MYPSMFIILGLYDYLIAEKIDVIDDTDNIKKLVDNINTIEDLKDPVIWKQFNVIVEIQPDDDLLPVRASYNDNSFTVGVNYLTSNETLYYGLPSVISSKLMTGKAPKINKALRFIPIGKQKTLKKSRISGVEIDPTKDNLFQILVEQKQHSKAVGDGRDKQIKILVNATSYGIYIELNRQDGESDVVVHSGNEVFTDHKRFEEKGNYFNPLISTIITDCAKLLLSVCEKILQEYNEEIAYCDTDSVYVPVHRADEVASFFDKLNPYKNVEHLLKIEEKDIWFYGISAKRYVIYDLSRNGDFVIKNDEKEENYSLHGLGHLANPFGEQEKHWQIQIWDDILNLQYNKITTNEFLEKYRTYFAISKFTVSTKSLMNRFAALNKGKAYKEFIKPFNFFLTGFGNTLDVKPISPFSKNSQSVVYDKFINYRDGKVMQGIEYFKTLEDELWGYVTHPESKLDGDKGLLQKRHFAADRVIYIGKEADKIDEKRGLERIDYNIYTSPKDIERVISKVLSLKWEDAKRIGMPRSQYYKIISMAKNGKLPNFRGKTMRKLEFLHLDD